MIGKKIPLLLLCLLCSIAFSSCAAHRPTTDSSAAGWSYALDNNTERTTREYLLVQAPGKVGQRRIQVVSACTKPYPAEGAYGTCMHAVSVEPGNKNFTLATGEDVAMVQFTWDAPLLLATIEYGCCAGHDTIHFYSEKGRYLGKTNTYSAAARFNSGSLITRTFDPGTGTRDDSVMYLLVSDEDRPDGFQALVFNNGAMVRKIPVVFPLPDREACGEWYVDTFVKYGGRDHLTLKLKGMWCLEEDAVLERSYRCSAGEKAVTCAPEVDDKKTPGN